MAETIYGHLLKKLNFQETPYGKAARFTGSDLEGLELTYYWVYFNIVGEIELGAGRHAHPHGECFFFTGLDYDNPNQFEAEIEIEMGEEGEKNVLNSTGVILAPPGFTHAPIVIRNADSKLFGGMMIYLGREYTHSSVPVKNEPPPAEKKYTYLLKKLEMRDTQRKEGGNADFIAGWNGKDIEGFNLNFTWAFHTGLGAWHGDRDPHTHPTDECLLFVGLDPDKPDYLGAEIEIGMGEEQEKHVFDTPTIVVVPAGLVHCPLITRRVDKPYGFSAISLNTSHETTWLGKV